MYAKNGLERILARALPWYVGDIYTKGEQLAYELESIFDERYNQNIYMVDVRKQFSKTMLTRDFVHPNVKGDMHISSTFFKEISEVYGLEYLGRTARYKSF